MKIASRKEFLALPNGILFRKYIPCEFQDMNIKTSTSENDFICVSFDWVDVDNPSQDDRHVLAKAVNEGESFKFAYDETFRDGLYDDELFAVYEKEDIEDLFGVIQGLLNSYPDKLR